MFDKCNYAVKSYKKYKKLKDNYSNLIFDANHVSFFEERKDAQEECDRLISEIVDDDNFEYWYRVISVSRPGFTIPLKLKKLNGDHLITIKEFLDDIYNSRDLLDDPDGYRYYPVRDGMVNYQFLISSHNLDEIPEETTHILCVNNTK